MLVCIIYFTTRLALAYRRPGCLCGVTILAATLPLRHWSGCGFNREGVGFVSTAWNLLCGGSGMCSHYGLRYSGTASLPA